LQHLAVHEMSPEFPLIKVVMSAI